MSYIVHMDEIIECVVNVSEGRDQEVIRKISSSISSCAGTTLLHTDIGYDANRTVFTFVADRYHMSLSIHALFATALDAINMSQHQGEHPRLGAIDVCPFIPISGISKETLIPWVHALAETISTKHKVPIYLYADSAQNDEHYHLAHIRRGEYEELKQRLNSGTRPPDFGVHHDSTKCGATVMGVRSFLLAYNVNLSTKDERLAKKIASQIRGSGYRDKNRQRVKGQFSSVRAIGWYMKEYGCAQVSMNLTDYHETGLYDVYEACKELASAQGISVTGSELIGLIPLEALIMTGKRYCQNTADEFQLIECANHHLGLSSLAPFIPKDRIIEYLLV